LALGWILGFIYNSDLEQGSEKKVRIQPDMEVVSTPVKFHCTNISYILSSVFLQDILNHKQLTSASS